MSRFFERGELKLLWPFYLEASVGTMLFILSPFLILYFLSIGLGMGQIGILMAIWPLASLIFEIPTGAVADLYGRKFSVILGWGVQGILLFIILLSTNFMYLVLLMFLIGISQTFVSGAYDAWVVDLLKKRGKRKLLPNYFTKRTVFINLGCIFSGIIGAFLVGHFGVPIIWAVSGLGLIISVLFLFFADEEFVKHEVDVSGSFSSLIKQVKKSVKYSYRHHILFYLLLITFLLVIFGNLFSSMTWTPLLKEYNFPDYAFGYLWSATAIIGLFSPMIASKLMKGRKKRGLLIGALILLFLLSCLILFANSVVLIILVLMLFYGVLDFYNPIFNVFFHRHTPTKMRATIGAINSVTMSIAALIALPTAGFLAEYVGPSYTIFIAGFFALIAAILYLRMRE